MHLASNGWKNTHAPLPSHTSTRGCSLAGKRSKMKRQKVERSTPSEKGKPPAATHSPTKETTYGRTGTLSAGAPATRRSQGRWHTAAQGGGGAGTTAGRRAAQLSASHAHQQHKAGLGAPASGTLSIAVLAQAARRDCPAAGHPDIPCPCLEWPHCAGRLNSPSSEPRTRAEPVCLCAKTSITTFRPPWIPRRAEIRQVSLGVARPQGRGRLSTKPSPSRVS